MNNQNRPLSFREKARIFRDLQDQEEKCAYVYDLLEDIMPVEDGWAQYNSESNDYTFICGGDYYVMKLMHDKYGFITEFSIKA
ncbi:Uncharacterised protein [Serratia fonticola]|uniref:hypothetical protein n=1 Tax=Serratia fonticola TaxID=47917 RepID=UPI00217C5F92|nr:hypothetical protein [Serratia fonticola]CAI0999258.1 Uncharacterised protein [Serratia fonticola]